MNRIVWTCAAVAVIGFTRGAVMADTAGDFEKLFGAEIRKAQATSSMRDDVELAASLLAGADLVGDRPALKVLIYEKAYELAVKDETGWPTAIKTIEHLMVVAPDREVEWREKLLTVCQTRYSHARGDERRPAGTALLKQLILVADSSLAMGQAAKAADLYRRAVALTGVLHSPGKNEIVAKLKAANARVALEQRIAVLRRQLETNLDDGKVRKTLIMLCLVELDNPAEAAKLIRDDVDQSLRTHVALAARPVEELAEDACLELGNWYERLAEKATSTGKASALTRARDYYQHYLTRHEKEDLPRIKATVALARVERALSKLTQTGVKSVATGGDAFGTVGDKVTNVTTVGHYIQVWRILPAHAGPGRYRVSIKHARSGQAGGFFMTAWADTNGDGAPDTHIASSSRPSVKQAGEWSSWEFQTKHENVFVGNFWLKATVHLYYQSGGSVKGYAGLSSDMYYSASPRNPPAKRTGPRYTNIRVTAVKR